MYFKLSELKNIDKGSAVRCRRFDQRIPSFCKARKGAAKMNFSDIIKKSVLNNFETGNINTETILTTLWVAASLGLFIYIVYRINVRSGCYNRSFNKTLAALPVITSGIMLAMQSNLVISLGMVGALSIVRFRNAVKDAADLTYLFWSISIGIISGAGLFPLALILSLFMAVLMLFLDLLPTFRPPCLLVVSGEPGLEEKELMARIRKNTISARVRSRNISKKGTDWVVEVRVRKEAQLAEAVAAADGILSVNLLRHDGEVRF